MADDTQATLSKRNTIAIEQTLNQLRQQVYDQQSRIDGLQSTVTNLSDRVSQLEQTIFLLKASLTGRGPTVK